MTTNLPAVSEATQIGELYRKARLSIEDSVLYLLEAGKRLIEHKNRLPHGKWQYWLAENRDILGFGSDAARRMMREASKQELALVLNEKNALQISRKIWGHDRQARIGTGNDDWYTPPEYIERARGVLGAIDLDPATSASAQENVKAAQFFTAEQNSLDKEWSGRVWLNPPYSRELIGVFVDRMVNEYQAGSITSGIMLTHNCTDTNWWQKAFRAASAVCFTTGRISFIDTVGERNSPTQGQTFFYFGKDVEKFKESFSDIGAVGVFLADESKAEIIELKEAA